MYLIHNQVIRFIDFCSVWKNQNRSNIGDSFHQFDLRLLEYYGVLPAREWSRVAIQARTVIREQTRNRESTVVHQGIPLPDSHFGCSLKFPSRQPFLSSPLLAPPARRPRGLHSLILLLHSRSQLRSTSPLIRLWAQSKFWTADSVGTSRNAFDSQSVNDARRKFVGKFRRCL